MKREDLIKLITDNFAEGEEVSFRYADDQGNVVTSKATFALDKTDYIREAIHTIIDFNGKVLKDGLTDSELDKILKELRNAGVKCTWKLNTSMSKIETVTTKVIDVS